MAATYHRTHGVTYLHGCYSFAAVVDAPQGVVADGSSITSKLARSKKPGATSASTPRAADITRTCEQDSTLFRQTVERIKEESGIETLKIRGQKPPQIELGNLGTNSKV